jgi:hypothetical protein
MAQSSNITLADLLSSRFAPIQEALLPLFDPKSIVALSKTSKEIRTTVRKIPNINKELKTFFKDPRGFRSVQAQCDALICNNFP